MNTSNIKSFSVHGLFGTDDVHIPFDENIKILIGENGLGKTQVLNLFYYTLTRNFFRLSEFSFDKLILEFYNKKPIEIPKSRVNELTKQIYDHPIIEDVIKDRFFNQFKIQNLMVEPEIIKNQLIQSKIELVYTSSDDFKSISEIKKRSGFTSQIGRKKAHIYNPFFSQCQKEIESVIGTTEIMYFPTYRRVEGNLHNLVYNNDELYYNNDELLNQENTLIQFGMDDVQKHFNNIQDTINRLLKEGFSEISSEILNQLIEDEDDISDSDFLNNIENNDVDILLSRVGNRITEPKKDKIRELLLNKVANPKNNSLNFFLKKLIEIHSSQKELDNSVKVFRDVCNKYLINKNVFYDESAIKIFIKSERNSCEIPLNKLSSGERQIISMFSKIYLSEAGKRFIVLFDEPELSLSIFWQRTLLPDIINSGKCDFLLAVTHSPFIFENELDRYAIGLNEYFYPV